MSVANTVDLKRNFSVLGFSCDNWLNETVNLTILPLSLSGPSGELPIDEFTAATQPLWSGGAGQLVPEPESASGLALQITCAANSSSCGPLAPATSKGPAVRCPVGCVSDGHWCQALATTFVNRQPSKTHPLPTEIDPGNRLDVQDFEAFNLRWKLSANYRAPPVGGACFPIGMQTVDFAPQSNRTISYYGNEVKQMSGCTGSSCSYKGVVGHPHAECLADGEYWPIVNTQNTAANVKNEDLYSTIEVDRGYFTSNTGTTRQIIVLEEGPLVVVDTLLPDANAERWVGAENGIFAPFVYKNEHFTKTGSGQT